MQQPEPDFGATTGRQEYLRRAGLKVADVNWWQAPDAPGDVSERHLDFMETIEAEQLVEVPEDFLGSGIERFRQMVPFRAAPLDPDVGTADTIMERADDPEPGKPVATRLVAFGNVSTEPIELKGGTLAGRYDLYVTLSPTQASPGEMTLSVAEPGALSGTFSSVVSLAPLFELRPVDGGDSIFVDTGEVALPGFPMDLASSGGHWSRVPPVEEAVALAEGRSLFYPGTVSIITQKLAPERGPGADFTLAKCDKHQATFTTAA